MRYFKKGAQPVSLTAAKKKAGALFGNLDAPCKNDLRAALGTDQGWLCCYCMQRIEDDNTSTKIEHRQSQSLSPALQLDWKNLLLACLGGEGHSRDEQHCDTRKGHRSITLDPTNPNIEARIRYSIDGRVIADNAVRDTEVNDVLGLNVEFLQRNRRAALEGAIQAMERRDARSWSAKKLGQFLSDAEQPTHGRLDEYVGFVVWWLRKQVAKRP